MRRFVLSLVFIIASLFKPISSLKCGDTYVVKKGDTLSFLIYKFYGRDRNLFSSFNPRILNLKTGQTLCLPVKRCASNSWNCAKLKNYNKGFPGGLNLNPAFPTSKLNKFSRFKSIGFVLDNGIPKYNYPNVVDWKLNDKVQSIKDQGSCAACWAFSATAAIESAYAIVNSVSGLSVSLSEQQLIDCLSAKCSGGWPKDALEYVSSNGGIATRNAYPFKGSGGTCLGNNNDASASAYGISMYEEVNFQGSLGLLLALQQQPVIVYVNSGWSGFQKYAGGVYEDYGCSPYTVDHSLVVVGYNLTNSPPYWILKNSWGVNWGLKGYMQMAITGGLGICGIHLLPGVYPVVPDKNPCGIINPCGSGTCTINPTTAKNQCACPPSFVSIKNLDDSESCTPVYVCTSFTMNPCGIGTCLDDLNGGYTCMCPTQFQIGYFTDGTLTCIPSILVTSTYSNYTVQPRDTCYLIANQFGLSISEFLAQNKDLSCNLLRSGIVVNTTSSFQSCQVSYAINVRDSCDSITQLFTLRANFLLTLNPGLDCSSLVPGQQVCVSRGLSVGVPICTSQQVVFPGDTCQSIMTSNSLSAFEFFRINPGIYCGNFAPVMSSQVPVIQVCVSAAPLGACACSTGRYYTVTSTDTCTRILVSYYRGSLTLFKSLNCNRACTNLYAKLRLCRP